MRPNAAKNGESLTAMGIFKTRFNSVVTSNS